MYNKNYRNVQWNSVFCLIFHSHFDPFWTRLWRNFNGTIPVDNPNHPRIYAWSVIIKKRWNVARFLDNFSYQVSDCDHPCRSPDWIGRHEPLNWLLKAFYLSKKTTWKIKIQISNTQILRTAAGYNIKISEYQRSKNDVIILMACCGYMSDFFFRIFIECYTYFFLAHLRRVSPDACQGIASARVIWPR